MKKTILTLIILLSSILVIAQDLPTMITVQGGTFTMGDEHDLGNDNEQPTHEVTLSTFKISKTEITVAQYRKYCNATGESMPKEPRWGWSENAPILNVSWNEAMKYCNWLSLKLNQNITLPTEAQWEYAARGGNQSKGYKFAGGTSMEIVGWVNGTSGGRTNTVAIKKANELGLYDMTGNVWEWCLDWYDASYYTNSPINNPKNNSKGENKYKVFRGGGWSSGITHVTTRHYYPPDMRINIIGFRVVSF